MAKRLFLKYTDLTDYTDKYGFLKDFSVRIRETCAEPVEVSA